MSYDKQVYKNVIKYLKDIGMNDLVKHIKKKNKKAPSDDDASVIWKEQSFINFPIFYLASLYLYDYAKSLKCTTFLFATRDCCHWYKIFHKLYPEADAHYFNCSRNMFRRGVNNPYFRAYVQSLIKDIKSTIYIDIHGTGLTMFRYFQSAFGEVPHCFMLSAKAKDYSGMPSISRKYFKEGKFINLVFRSRATPIEMLNYDIVGTLQNYDETGPVRDKLEYNKNLIQNYHNCTKALLKKLPNPPNIKRDKLHKAIIQMFEGILTKRPIISKQIVHMLSHGKKHAKKLEQINI